MPADNGHARPEVESPSGQTQNLRDEIARGRDWSGTRNWLGAFRSMACSPRAETIRVRCPKNSSTDSRPIIGRRDSRKLSSFDSMVFPFNIIVRIMFAMRGLVKLILPP